MRAFAIHLFAALSVPMLGIGADPETPEVAEGAAPDLEDTFDREELGAGWNVGKGEWKIVDGVLRVRELVADDHAAAARRAILTQDAVYETRFRFVGKGAKRGFHFGFDPAKGELEKKGHLFSVIFSPTSWRIVKHGDKARPEEDPNEILTQAETDFESGIWYALKVTTAGDTVTAEIAGKKQNLEAEHPTFHVKKPALVFRCIGDGVEIDDIKVWSDAGKK